MERTPDDFQEALVAEPGAAERFAELPPSHRREYLEWIGSAKRAHTRANRIAKAVVQIMETEIER